MLNKSILKLGLPHVVAVLFFFLLNSMFFYPQYQGKVLRQSDIVNYLAASNEIRTYQEETGKPLYWTNAMFGGMPGYQISSKIPGRTISWGERILQLNQSRPVGYFLGIMIGFYIMMVLLGVNPWLSMIAAVVYAFSTYNFALYEAGHSNKIRTLAFFPFILSGLLLMAEKKKYLIGGILFTFGLALNFNANHVQMTYYFFLCLLVFGGAYLVPYLKQKDYLNLGKTVLIAIVGLGLSLGAVLAHMWSTYEYGQETMRGTPILEATATTAAAQSSSATDGLSYEYAMRWSNNWQDLMTILAPRAAGGSNGEAVKSGNLYDAYRRSGARPAADGSIPVGLYFGGLPFTSGPTYFGAISLFLFVLGLILVKGPLRWALGISVLLTVLLSLGGNLDWFQRIFFDYFPFYNKFRAPSSVLTITALFIPFLGFYAVSKLLKKDYSTQEVIRGLYIAGGLTGGLALVLWAIGGGMFNFSTASDASMQVEIQQMIINDRKAFFKSDMLRSAGLILAAMALLWAYAKGHLKWTLLVAGLAIFTIGDLWVVGRRYIKPANFVSARTYDDSFTPRPVDQQIIAQEPHRGAYRVFDVSADPWNSAQASYHHNTIGGYSAAKLQRYQDLIDYHISQNNMAVLNMLNGKYVINREQQVQTNPGALGNAWLVEDIQKVNTPNEEIEALNGFDPANTAVVLDQEFDNYIGAFDPQKNGTITLSKYDPQNLEYSFNSTSEQLAVFSEIWYSPKKGWKAYIDDQEVSFIRANYALRALRVPAGQHSIRFEFKPRSIYLGSTIAAIIGWLILLSTLGLAGFYLYQFIQNPPKVEEVSKKKSKTSSKARKKAPLKKTKPRGKQK